MFNDCYSHDATVTNTLRMITRSYCILVLVGLCLAMSTGCDEAPDLSTVSGAVAYRGKLLDHGSLRFFGADGRPISAVIQSDGSYEIQLPPDAYRVSVTSPPVGKPNEDPKDDTPPPLDRNALPSRFSHITKSGLKFTVQLQVEPITWDIELE